MRFIGFLSLLCAALAASGIRSSTAAAPAAAASKPIQIRVRLQTAVLQQGALTTSRAAGVKEFLNKQLLAGAGMHDLRAALAAEIAKGTAMVADEVTITTMQGVPFRIESGDSMRGKFSGTIQPRRDKGQIRANLDLSYRLGRGETGREQGFRQTVAVPDGGEVAVGFAGARDAPLERVVLLQFTHLAE